MDLSTLNVEQLKDLLKKIPAEIKRRTEEVSNAAREAAIEKLKAIAREHGYSLEELAGTKKPRKSSGGALFDGLAYLGATGLRAPPDDLRGFLVPASSSSE